MPVIPFSAPGDLSGACNAAVMLDHKKRRVINNALTQLFGRKSFVAPTSNRDFIVNGTWERELRLTNNRAALLTDVGLSQMERIVEIIDKASTFDGLASFRDIWLVLRETLEDALSSGKHIHTCEELLKILREKLDARIHNYTYAVPFFGVDLDDIDVVTLGKIKIVRSPVPYLEEIGVRHDHASLQITIEAAKAYLWIIGSASGTEPMAQEKFRENAELAVGTLAIAAASMYTRGASASRIGVVMSPEQGYGRATWLTWNDSLLELETRYNFACSQPFRIDSELARKIATDNFFARVFEICESNSRTELEDAIMRAIYWFSDAQRDLVPVMKLIKYWSCVEIFFSADCKNIARSVSTGLASVLVDDAYKFVPESEYHSLTKEIAGYYKLRSKAVHKGRYSHISDRNVENLSKWVAWMLISMVSFVGRGYTTVAEIKTISDQLDGKHRL